jgi:hypothetical protein
MRKPQKLDDDCIVFPSTGVFGAHYCRTCGGVELSPVFDDVDSMDDYLFWRQMGDEPYCLYSAESLDRLLYNKGDSEYMGKLLALVTPDVMKKLKPCKKEMAGEGSGFTVVRV